MARRYGLHFLTSGLRQSATETFFFCIYASEIPDAELKPKARETLNKENWSDNLELLLGIESGTLEYSCDASQYITDKSEPQEV